MSVSWTILGCTAAPCGIMEHCIDMLDMDSGDALVLPADDADHPAGLCELNGAEDARLRAAG
jgi:hypothetical protein